jgi:hypothetical protein
MFETWNWTVRRPRSLEGDVLGGHDCDLGRRRAGGGFGMFASLFAAQQLRRVGQRVAGDGPASAGRPGGGSLRAA